MKKSKPPPRPKKSRRKTTNFDEVTDERIERIARAQGRSYANVVFGAVPLLAKKCR